MKNYYESVSNQTQKYPQKTFEGLQTEGCLGHDHTEYGICAKRLLVPGKCRSKSKRHNYLSIANTDSLAEESILDEDDRDPVRLIDSDTLPWRMICSLVASGENGPLKGTGWFVGSKTIITAAHNVFDLEDLGGWATSVKLYPGRYGFSFPYPTNPAFSKPIVSNKYKVLNGWFDQDNPKKSNYDLAVIYLDEPVGDETGWFSIAVRDDDFIEDLVVNVSGYPVDKGGGKYQYFSKGIVDVNKSDKFRIFYTADTEGGQSGGPVWFQDERNQPIVVGIHTYGVSRGFTLNSATRVNPDIFGVIQGWIAES